MYNYGMYSLGGFIVASAIIGFIGWVIIEALIWLFSFVTISIG